MINHLSIRDFATIENTDVDFQKGLNIITGETGSGKSVVVEAISLALGSRADNTFVRSGCEKATVQMVAEYENKEIIIIRQSRRQIQNGFAARPRLIVRISQAE